MVCGFFMLVFLVIKLILLKIVLVMYKFIINGLINKSRLEVFNYCFENVWDFLFIFNGFCFIDR